MASVTRKTVKVDERGRASLTGLSDHDLYEGYRTPDGVITLIPADRVSAEIEALLKSKVGVGERPR